MATINQILQAAKTIDFIFDEFTRTARQEKLKAKFKGDTAAFKTIDKNWREAKSAKDAALDILEDKMLSSAVTDQILAQIVARKNEANALLEKLRKAQKKLKLIEDAAHLATKLLKDLRKII